jgi:hypothetical protein
LQDYSRINPKKEKKKFLNIKQKIQICKLKNSLIKSKNGSQFKNCKRKINSWTPADKGFALTLYKRGPRCYRFLSKILKLPSKSTLQKNLRNIGKYLFISWTYCPKKFQKNIIRINFAPFLLMRYLCLQI